ncbi:unnamed protein product [Owenia fusiformis]|uniref:Uncharacterized protein n=1 Tax=Owenia fusiformis TaxID=6347 RepID=A0A8J1T5A8_OWEFU|nr:unnamed protein product [Owenia fusiformis]
MDESDSKYTEVIMPLDFNETLFNGTKETLCVVNETVLNTSLCNHSNVTNSASIAPPASPYLAWQQVIIGVVLAIMLAGTILGNILVCCAVGIVRKLRTPSNMLIVSLAVSDLLVGLCVMPFTTYYQLRGHWLLGSILCDIYTSLDVLLCTASILNLCAISVDRYFVITRPFQYAAKRTPRRMAVMVVIVWLIAAVISIPPMFGWKSLYVQGFCIISQNIGYQFYATFGAFYLPLFVMIVVYYRIYRVSSRLAKTEQRQQGGSSLTNDTSPKLRSHSTSSIKDIFRLKSPWKSTKRDSVDTSKEENHNYPNGDLKIDDSSGVLIPPSRNPPQRSHSHSPRLSSARKSIFQRLSRKDNHHHHNATERKATKTLGVIMGGFTACWLPFFILAVIRPFCVDPETQLDCIPVWLTSVFQWLGYANSLLNPIIYARFNRDFRAPFREILCCRCSGINMRLRSKSYIDEYGSSRPIVLRDNLRSTRITCTMPSDTVVRFSSKNGDTETALKMIGDSCNGDKHDL